MPSIPGKPAVFTPDPKPPTPAVFHFNDLTVSGIWEESTTLGSPGVFKIDETEGKKLRGVTTDGLLLVNNSVPLKGKMVNFLFWVIRWIIAHILLINCYAATVQRTWS